MAHDVFISHSSKDKPIADAICAHIEAAGTRCWIAPRDITPGVDWPTAITRAISQSKVLVLVFSAHSNSSEDVGRELYLAANHKLVIIPFKIENVEPEPGKQYYLARTHWLDALNPPTQEQIQNLVERVSTLVPIKGSAIRENQVQSGISIGAATSPKERTQTKKKNRISPWLWWGSAGVILFGLLGWSLVSLAMKYYSVANQPTQIPTSIITTSSSATIVPTLAKTILPKDTVSTPAGSISQSFPKVYISDTFIDNSLDWPVGNSADPNWLGNLEIAYGVLDWKGNSVTRMNALIHPRLASLQDDLADQEVSARINLTTQDSKGAYGLYLRASKDENHFYAFYVLNSSFGFMVLNGENKWKNLFGWDITPSVSENGWVKMSVQVTGSHFKLFVNDQLLTELDDTSLSSGQSGLILSAYSADKQIQTQFDDFEVRLPSEVAQAPLTTAQLDVTISPNPAKFQPGENGIPYTCEYKNTVKAIGTGVRIEKFGMDTWENNQWVHSPSNSGQAWLPADFADWYSCPGAYIGAGQSCSDPNNWSGVSNPILFKGKWYYIGVDDNGNEVQGEATIECQL